ncbi:MAG TPA: DUF5103 domain-containing protein [Bacteroidales bacterium]|nr:DUF5103 domain-containing protein [Bacteroidales bacterium]
MNRTKQTNKYLIRYFKIIKLIMLFSFFMILTGRTTLNGQMIYSDQIYSNKIKTVQLYREEWNLSYPILRLNSQEKLVLHFDLLDDHSENYYYTFIHCDKNWKKSDIFESDYMNGFTENPFDNYKPSFNTTTSYYHYKVSFPNDRVSLTRSGNYVILVYPADNPEEPVLMKRFMISEDAVRINITTHRPMMTANNNSSQQVDFIVNQIGRNIIDPYRNFYAFILQNGRWDNAKRNLKPEFYSNNELKYNSLSDKNIFYGGNEFRYFDIKSLRYQTEYVKSIDYASPGYNVFLFPSENREFKPYFYNKDFNGKYFIAIQEGRDYDTDADYVSVYFTLPSKQKIAGGNLFISGALNNWEYDDTNIMTYNPVVGQYECTMLLKQGYYNYEFAFLKEGSTDGTPTVFEGSHYETENDYIVLIYYRNPQDRHDRLIGMGLANSINKPSN